MGHLSLTLLRIGFLALLWAFVLMAVAVLRADIYGTRVLTRGRGRTPRPSPGQTTSAMPAVPPSRSRTGVRRSSEPAPSDSSNEGRYLAVVAGPLKGTTIPLGSNTVTIGRTPTATLVLEDDYCSARHARIFLEREVWNVEDLGSTNGTFLDDARLTDPVEFRIGSRIRLGATEVEMRR